MQHAGSYQVIHLSLIHIYDEILEMLLVGKFESSASWKVLELVSRSLEGVLNAQTEKLLKMFQEDTLSESDIDWALTKYDKACRRAMLFCDIPHLPPEGVYALGRDAMRYMREVYRKIRFEYERCV